MPTTKIPENEIRQPPPRVNGEGTEEAPQKVNAVAVPPELWQAIVEHLRSHPAPFKEMEPLLRNMAQCQVMELEVRQK